MAAEAIERLFVQLAETEVEAVVIASAGCVVDLTRSLPPHASCANISPGKLNRIGFYYFDTSNHYSASIIGRATCSPRVGSDKSSALKVFDVMDGRM
jgi:hypothetical protein